MRFSRSRNINVFKLHLEQFKVTVSMVLDNDNECILSFEMCETYCIVLHCIALHCMLI